MFDVLVTVSYPCLYIFLLSDLTFQSPPLDSSDLLQLLQSLPPANLNTSNPDIRSLCTWNFSQFSVLSISISLHRKYWSSQKVPHFRSQKHEHELQNPQRRPQSPGIPNLQHPPTAEFHSQHKQLIKALMVSSSNQHDIGTLTSHHHNKNHDHHSHYQKLHKSLSSGVWHRTTSICIPHVHVLRHKSFNTKQKLQTDRKRDNVCTQNIEFSQDFSLSIRAIIFSQLVVLLTPHNTQSAPYNLVMHLIIIFVAVSGGICRAKWKSV